jgi:hypothetical protein
MHSRGELCTRRVAAMIALTWILALSACGNNDPTGAHSNVLVGRWGSATVELVAINAGAELADGCNTVVINRPILLREDSSFQVGGRVRAGLVSSGGREITVEGRVLGSTITVTAEFYAADGPTALTLESGVAPGPDYNPECPL